MVRSTRPTRLRAQGLRASASRASDRPDPARHGRRGCRGTGPPEPARRPAPALPARRWPARRGPARGGLPSDRRGPRSVGPVWGRRAWRSSSSGPLLGLGHVGHLDAQGGRQVDLVLLLVDQDRADVLGHGVLAERLALADALAVVADRLVLVIEVEAEHVLGLFRLLDRLGRDAWHPAQVVDLL